MLDTERELGNEPELPEGNLQGVVVVREAE
jgi:hypothetical protein